MAGHNKWSKIKRQKGKSDAEKSKVFSKLARAITTASREAKGDTSSPTLRAAIDKAREYNMPTDNIDRAVAKGVGVGAEALESIMYEAYGPGGTALVILALTSNRNKAAQEIKHILSKNGLELARPGSALWAFSKNETGELVPNAEIPVSEEDSQVLEALINELEDNEEVQEIFTNAS